jgi:integrase/recombinase XerD
MSTPFSAAETGFQPPQVSFTYDPEGNRKYLTLSERKRFIRAANSLEDTTVRAFCLLLAFSGARLSEIAMLTPRQVDLEAGMIVIRCLKKRYRPGFPPAYRAVPIPKFLISEITSLIRMLERDKSDRIWPWCRTTAWKRVKEVMRLAKISGVQASPKGLRHGFAVGALVAGVPDITVMRWLGHARLETTMIYTEAIGAEAQTIAKRMWEPLLPKK